MKNKLFRDLLRGLDQVRKIHSGRMKPGRVFKFNKAQIIKDHNNNLYLKVELVDSYVYFKIEEYNTKPEGKIVKLSDNFLINLKGGKRKWIFLKSKVRENKRKKK